MKIVSITSKRTPRMAEIEIEYIFSDKRSTHKTRMSKLAALKRELEAQDPDGGIIRMINMINFMLLSGSQDRK
jgi:hypothetical protein